MKRVLSALLVLMLAAVLCSCDTAGSSGSWIRNMEVALSQRLQRARHPESGDLRSALEAQVEGELQALGSVDTYVFPNEELKALAQEYLDALLQEKAGLEVYGTEEYLQLFIREGHYRRAAAVKKMAEQYGLNVTGAAEADFRRLLDDCDAFTEEQGILELLNGICPDASRNLDGSCTMVLHNPAQAELTNVTVTIGTDNRKALSSWQAGADWEISLTPEEASRLQTVTIRFVSQKTNLVWQSEPIPVTASDADGKPGVTFILKNELPGDFTPDSWYHRVTCHVTGFSSRLVESKDGKESWQLHLKGSKSYDVAGPENRSMCHVDFRITDEEGEQIFFTGTFYTPEILLDETFEHCIAFVPDLEPGTYYVELLDPAC